MGTRLFRKKLNARNYLEMSSNSNVLLKPSRRGSYAPPLTERSVRISRTTLS